MIRILIVEDEKPIADLLDMSLTAAGYTCDCLMSGTAAADAVGEKRYDLILLDVMLPGIDGFELMEYLAPLGIPVIFITARSAVKDKIRGLKLGADDYIVKPFSIRELLARIEAVLRRSPERPRQLREIRIPGATLDSANRLITFKDGRETSLTAREFEFLTYMATHPNRVITRDELLRRVWDVDPRLTDTRSVEMTVMRLRDKLGAASASPLETLRSQGYRWNSSFVS